MESAPPLYVYGCVCVWLYIHADVGVGGVRAVYVLQKKKEEKEILRMSKQVLYVPECVYVG